MTFSEIPVDASAETHADPLDLIYTPIRNDLAVLEERIVERLNTEVAIIGQAAHYLIDAGGKRIRPAILLAFARLMNAPSDSAIELAAVVEFIHSATLLHDDVVDDAQLRRGLDSPNLRFGNAVSVLVGDFLYSRAFQMMVRVNRLEVMRILSEATNTIAEGEVLQLMNIGNLALTREAYHQTIDCKTARLFEAAAELAVVISQPVSQDSHPSQEIATFRQQARNFGKHIGHAFQLVDDALDYAGDREESGKEIAHDLREGKITLPLLIALEESPQAQEIGQAIRDGSEGKAAMVMEAVAQCHGVDKTLALAQEEADKAIQCLQLFPDHPAKLMLVALAQFVRRRRF